MFGFSPLSSAPLSSLFSTVRTYTVSISETGNASDPIITAIGNFGVIGYEYSNKNYLNFPNNYRVSPWFTGNAVVSNAAVLAPDGTYTGQLLKETVASSAHSLNYGLTLPKANTTYTLSCYVKPYTADRIVNLQFHENPAYAYAVIQLGANLSSIDAVPQVTPRSSYSNASGTVTAAANGWYRVNITATTGIQGSTTVSLLLNNAGAQNYAGNGNSGIYLWGMQFEEGSSPTAVQNPYSTDSGASQVSFIPQLTEIATITTNLYNVSENFSDSTYWYPFRISVTPNYAVAPDGSNTASLLTATGDYANMAVVPNASTSVFNVNPGEYWTVSIYVKYVNNQYVSIPNEVTGGVSSLAVFDIINGTINNQAYNCTNATITSVGSGWWRVTATTLIPAGGSGWNPHPIWLGQYTGGQTGTAALFWGAQMERSATASAYQQKPLRDSAGVTVVSRDIKEIGTTNLVDYSQNPVSWEFRLSTLQSTTELAPDGTNTAVRYTPTAQYGGVLPGALTNTPNWLHDTPMVGSVWLRVASGTKQVGLGLNAGGMGVFVTVTTTWQRFSSSYTKSANYNDFFNIYEPSSTGFVDIYVWGFQVEVGTTASAYQVKPIVESTTPQLLFTPQLTETGTSVDEYKVAANLVTASSEKASRNLLNNSNNFNQTLYWGLNGGSVSPNSIISPDGTQNASTITGGSAFNGVNQGWYATAGTIYTYSVYLKYISGSTECILGPDANPTNSDRQMYVNIQTGTISLTGTKLITSGVTDAGNGWYRFYATFNQPNPGYTDITIYESWRTGGAMQFGVYGAQVEYGNNATSLVMTPLQELSSNTLATTLTSQEKLNKNLVAYPEDITNIGWGKLNISSIVLATAPDNSFTANLVTPSAKTNAQFEVTTGTFVGFQVYYTRIGQTYTFSVYAKPNGYNYIRLSFGNIAGFGLAFFNVLTGTVGTTTANTAPNNFSAAIAPAGNGYYRCSITYTATSIGVVNSDIYILSADNQYNWTSDGTSGVYLYGAQFEEGSLSSYVSVANYGNTQTTTSAAAPQITESGGANDSESSQADFYPPVLTESGSANDSETVSAVNTATKIELARKNLVVKSNVFDNTNYWSQTAATPIPYATVSPFGTTDAYFLRESATLNNGHYLQQVPLWEKGYQYTYSIYAKASTRTYLFLLIGSGAIPGQQNALFNLTTGAISQLNVTNGTTAAVTDVGNGWWRCSITTPAAISTGFSTIWASVADNTQSVNYTGDGTSGIYIYGAQVERGTVPTAYVDYEDTSIVTGGYSLALPITETGTAVDSEDQVVAAARSTKEWATTNFVDYSQDGTQWGLNPGTTIISTTELAPDGTYTAVRVRPTLNYSGVRSSTGVWLHDTQMVGSAWVKVDTGTQALQLGLGGGGLATNITATTTWTRVYGTLLKSANYNDNFLVMSIDASHGDFLVWGIQVEVGSTPSTYQVKPIVESQYNTTIFNGARAVERISKNRYLNSEDITPWGKNNVTFSVNSVANPIDGALTADLVSNTVNLTSNINTSQISNGSWIAGTIMTKSIYVKYISGAPYLYFQAIPVAITAVNNNGTYFVAAFDFTTGCILQSVSGNSTASIIDVGGGWFRLIQTVTVPSSNTGTSTPIIGDSFFIGAYGSTSISTTFAVYGAQLEFGSVATAYQYTGAAGVGGSSIDTLANTLQFSRAKNEIANKNLLNTASASETFTSGWTGNSGTIVQNATIAPDGISPAIKLVEVATGSPTSNQRMYYKPAVEGGTVYTYSVYLKPAERLYASVYFEDNTQLGGGRVGQYLNLQTGTITSTYQTGTNTLLGSNLQSLPNGWFRYSWTVKAVLSQIANSGAYIILRMGDTPTNFAYDGDGTSGMYFWGAQMEIGDTVTPYVSVSSYGNAQTSTTAVNNNLTETGTAIETEDNTTSANSALTESGTAVENYQNTLASLSYSYESSNNNLLSLAAEDFSLWNKNTAPNDWTVNTNVAVAPNGTNTADLIIRPAGFGSSVVYKSFPLNMAGQTNTSYVGSIYLKAAGYSKARVNFENNAFNNVSYGASVDLIAGTVYQVLNGSTVTITDAGNGWWRITVTARSDADGGNYIFAFSPADSSYNQSFIGDGASGIYAWGAQVEYGTVASPYVSSSLADSSTNTTALTAITPEYSRTNIFNSSEVLTSSPWVATNATIIPGIIDTNSGALSYKLIDANANTGNKEIYQNQYWIKGATYTVSVYVKAAERDTFRIGLQNGTIMASSGNAYFYVPNNGTGNNFFTNGYSSNTITYIANGWYRCTATFTVNGTGGFGGIYFTMATNGGASTNTNYTGDGTSGMYFLRPQVELGSVATPWTLSTIDAETTTVANLSAISESSSKNLIKFSNDFSNSLWFAGGVVKTSINNSAPDGSSNALLFTTLGGGGLQSFYEGLIPVTPNTTYTYSFYAKLGTLVSSEWLFAVYNETALTMIASDIIPSITLDTTWQRVTYTFTTPVNCSIIRVYPFRNFGLATVKTGYVWGPQLELGSVATTYVYGLSDVNTNTAVFSPASSEKLINNRLTYSEDFNNGLYWLKQAGMTFLPNYIDPNGNNTATKLVESTNNYFQRMYVAHQLTNTMATLSCYVKSDGSSRNVYLKLWDSVTDMGVVFNPSTGAFVSYSPVAITGSYSATAVGNGWYRLAISTYLTKSGDVAIGLTNGTTYVPYAGDTTVGVYVWGVQLETGDTVTNYVKMPVSEIATPSFITYTSLSEQSGTIFDTVTGDRLNNAPYSIETVTAQESNSNTISTSTSRKEILNKNTLLFPEDFTNFNWGKSLISLTPGIIAPDGTPTAYKLGESSSIIVGNNYHYVVQYPVTYSAGITYTISVFAKAAERTLLQIQSDATSSSIVGIFDLSNGTLGGAPGGGALNITGAITDAGNGWYRCSVTGMSKVNVNAGIKILLGNAGYGNQYNGDGTSGFYIWGAQIEQGSLSPYVSYENYGNLKTVQADFYPALPIENVSAVESETGFPATTSILTETSTANDSETNSLTTSISNKEVVNKNLFTAPEDFTTGWQLDIYTNAVTIPSVISNPFGGSTATKIAGNTSSGTHSIQWNGYYTNLRMFSGVSNAISIYVKVAEYTKFYICDAGAGTFAATFDLTAVTATVVSNCTASITSAGNGWYRCSVILPPTIVFGIYTRPGFGGYPNNAISAGTYGFSYTGDNTSGVYVWGAQLELNNSVTPYVSIADYGNTQTPAIISPTVRTEKLNKNLLPYPENFIAGISSGAMYQQGSVTLTPDATLSPFGLPSYKYTISGAYSRGLGYYYDLIPNKQYTFSIYLKAIVDTSYTFALVTRSSGYLNPYGPIEFLLTNTPLTVAAGWTRASFTFVPIAAAQIQVQDYSGFIGDRFYFFGAQLEEGTLTSYAIDDVYGNSAQANANFYPLLPIEKVTAIESESVSAVNTITLTETGTGNSSQSVAVANNTTLTETGTGNDSQSYLAVFNNNLTETGNANDGKTIQANFYPALPIETVTSNESSAKTLSFGQSITETGTATEQYVTLLSYLASRLESSTASDYASTGFPLFTNISETVSANALQNATGYFVVNRQEALNALDIKDYTLSPGGILTEIANSLDSQTAQSLVSKGILEQVDLKDYLVSVDFASSYIIEKVTAIDGTLSFVFISIDYELVSSRPASQIDIIADEIYVDNLDVFYMDDAHMFADVLLEYDQIYVDNIDVLYGNIARIDDISGDEIYI